MMLDTTPIRLENERLRDRIEELEEILGVKEVDVPPSFQTVNARRVSWRLFCHLARRGYCNRERAMTALYSDRDPADRPHPRIFDSMMTGIRRFAHHHGIEITTVYNEGWVMAAPMQKKALALIERLRQGA